MKGAEGDGAPVQSPHQLRGAEAWRTHAVLVLGVAFCALAFWFELGRAERGNALSWAYVFEWPLLAIFAVYMWWKVLHGESTSRRRQSREPGLAPEYEGMLKAWQSHQVELADAQRRDAQRDAQAESDGERGRDVESSDGPA